MSLGKKFRLPSLVVGISVVMTVAAIDPTEAATGSRFCRDISQLSDKVGQLEDIRASTSVGDLKEIQREVLGALGNITLSGAEEMGGVKVNELRENLRNIDRVMDDIDDDTTLNDIVSQVLNQVVGIANVTTIVEGVSECRSEF